MHVIILPYTTYPQFVYALNNGEVDKMKGPGELFAFTYYGHASLTTFPNASALRQWLTRYEAFTDPRTGDVVKDREKAYARFVLYRLAPGAENSLLFQRNQESRRLRREMYSGETQQRQYIRKRKKISEYGVYDQDRIREKNAAAAKRRRDNIKADPAKYEAMQAANRERALRSYHNNKKLKRDQ